MKCYVNDQVIPCDIFWHQYGLIFCVVFIAIGLLFLIKTDWVLKYQIWQQKIFGSTWVPGKLIPKIYKVTGLIFLVIGLVFLYLSLFSINTDFRPGVKSADNIEWKTASFNGAALVLKYPSKICYNEETDCYNTSVLDDNGHILLSTIRNGISTPFFSVDYSLNYDIRTAEEYLRSKYNLSESIKWKTNSNNPDVKILGNSSAGPGLKAAYSDVGLVSFYLQPACLIQCGETDKRFLESIIFDGVQIISE